MKATELARIAALHEHGGIYLDADVELTAPLDFLLEHEFFIGCESTTLLNGAVMGSIPRGRVIRELLEAFPLDDEGRHPANEYGPLFITEVIARSDASERELTVLPTDCFYPYAWDQRPEDAVMTERTVAIHHWAKSWW